MVRREGEVTVPRQTCHYSEITPNVFDNVRPTIFELLVVSLKVMGRTEVVTDRRPDGRYVNGR